VKKRVCGALLIPRSAVVQGVLTAQKSLRERAGLQATNHANETPLLLAAKNGHGQVVKLLLDKGANVNAQGGHYGNALHAASEQGHEAVVKMLLDKRADINAQDREELLLSGGLLLRCLLMALQSCFLDRNTRTSYASLA
jgi:ankyrin repeat protein